MLLIVVFVGAGRVGGVMGVGCSFGLVAGPWRVEVVATIFVGTAGLVFAEIFVELPDVVLIMGSATLVVFLFVVCFGVLGVFKVGKEEGTCAEDVEEVVSVSFFVDDEDEGK